jgi:phosphohistidine phosphatase SixA
MNLCRFGRGRASFLMAALSVAQIVFSHEPALAASDLPSMVVLVRHADKASKPPDDPPLTNAGIKRAQDLAVALGDTNLTAIITTQLRRTRETAAPIAAALGLTAEPIGLDPKQSDAHVKAVLAALRNRAGTPVLVIGHSTTVPALIEALGGPHVPVICETVYDEMFSLVPTSAKPAVVRSRYGAPSSRKGCK